MANNKGSKDQIDINVSRRMDAVGVVITIKQSNDDPVEIYDNDIAAAWVKRIIDEFLAR